MGVAGTIFELRPPDFGKILIFSKCSNDSKTIFWYFQRSEKYKKSVSLSIQLIPRSTNRVKCRYFWVQGVIFLVFCAYPFCHIWYYLSNDCHLRPNWQWLTYGMRVIRWRFSHLWQKVIMQNFGEQYKKSIWQEVSYLFSGISHWTCYLLNKKWI